MPKKVKVAWVLCCILVFIGFVYVTIQSQIRENKARQEERAAQIKQRQEEKKEDLKKKFEIMKRVDRLKGHVTNGDYAKAETLAKEIEQEDPNNAELYTWWGISLVKAERRDEALDKFIKSAQINPNSARTYIYWGLTLDMKGKHKEAIDKYENALLIEPENSNAYAYWGASLAKMGEHDKAIAKLEESLQFNKFNETAYGVLVDSLYHKGLYEKAWDVVKRAREAKVDISKGSLERLSAALPEPI